MGLLLCAVHSGSGYYLLLLFLTLSGGLTGLLLCVVHFAGGYYWLLLPVPDVVWWVNGPPALCGAFWEWILFVVVACCCS